MNKIIFVVVAVLLLLSCRTTDLQKPNKLLPIDYVGWVENKDNGLRIEQADSLYRYELQYQPVAYLAIWQMRNPQITPAALRQEIENRGGYLYFNFKMQLKGGKGILSDADMDMASKNSYLLSGLQKDMFVLSGNDSLPCVMSHFESANSLIPYDQCVLAFEKPKEEKGDLVFLFRTDAYQKGWVKMPVKRENINQIPQLKIK